jgi:hypothetical protein
LFYFDTSAVPPGATVLSAKLIVYDIQTFGATGVRDSLILVKDAATYPHSPLDGDDYHITNWAGEIGTKARGTLVDSAYNDITITDLTAITKGGITRFAGFYSADWDNEEPGVDGNYGALMDGSSGGSPPKLEITYDATVTTFTATTDTVRASRTDLAASGYPNVHDDANADTLAAQVFLGNALDSGLYIVARGMLIFPTAALAGKVILSARLRLYLQFKNLSDIVQIQNGQPTYPHVPVVAGDYLYTQFSGDGGNVTDAGWTATAYNDIVLNAAGLTWINTGGGDTKLCIRYGDDINNVTPVSNSYAFVGNATVPGTEPLLEVTWTDAPPAVAAFSCNAAKLIGYGII